MACTITTTKNFPLVVHNGIFRAYEFTKSKKLKEKKHSRISIPLHSYAAHTIQKIYKNKKYMFTLPLSGMRNIMTKALNEESYWLGEESEVMVLKKIINQTKKEIQEKEIQEKEIQEKEIQEIDYKEIDYINDEDYNDYKEGSYNENDYCYYIYKIIEEYSKINNINDDDDIEIEDLWNEILQKKEDKNNSVVKIFKKYNKIILDTLNKERKEKLKTLQVQLNLRNHNKKLPIKRYWNKDEEKSYIQIDKQDFKSPTFMENDTFSFKRNTPTITIKYADLANAWK